MCLQKPAVLKTLNLLQNIGANLCYGTLNQGETLKKLFLCILKQQQKKVTILCVAQNENI